MKNKNQLKLQRKTLAQLQLLLVQHDSWIKDEVSDDENYHSLRTDVDTSSRESIINWVMSITTEEALDEFLNTRWII